MPIMKRAHKRRSPQQLEAARKEAFALLVEAKAFHEAGDAKMAARRVTQARRAAMRVQLPLREAWHRFCRNCDSYLVQGENSTIRIKKGARILRCQRCGYVRRKLLRS